jgi:hypothetical protein
LPLLEILSPLPECSRPNQNALAPTGILAPLLGILSPLLGILSPLPEEPLFLLKMSTYLCIVCESVYVNENLKTFVNPVWLLLDRDEMD